MTVDSLDSLQQVFECVLAREKINIISSQVKQQKM